MAESGADKGKHEIGDWVGLGGRISGIETKAALVRLGG
jgi:hypothetical protein